MSISKGPTVIIGGSDYDKPMPIIGLTTYLIRGNGFKKTIKDAIASGYRNFECNFDLKEITALVEVINEQISLGIVTNKDIFLTVKCTLPIDVYAEDHYIYELFRESRKKKGLECIDLLLVHIPISTKKKEKKKKPEPDTKEKYYTHTVSNICNGWFSFMEFWRHGLTCMLGLSNFSAEQVKHIVLYGSYYPRVNRIDSSQYLIPNELIEVCKAHDIVLTSFNSLGKHQEHKKFKSLPVVTDPRIFDIAKRYKKSTPEIIARYLAESGTISKDYLQENTDIFKFKLKPNEMKTLEDSAYCFSKFFAHDVIYYKDRNDVNQT